MHPRLMPSKQPDGNRDGRAQEPSPWREMEACGGDDEGQGDEGADADHLKHVEEDRGAEADAAFEMWRVVGIGGWDHAVASIP